MSSSHFLQRKYLHGHNDHNEYLIRVFLHRDSECIFLETEIMIRNLLSFYLKIISCEILF